VTDTILMIHGMWGGSWLWEHFRRAFEAKGYRCIAPTLPYHDMDPRGAPDPRLGTASLLDYVEFLEQQIAGLDSKPIVMGHSMGGLLAQILAARGHAKLLVLLSPASPAGIIAITPSVLKSFWSVQTKWGFWKNPMRQTFAEAVYSMMHLLPEEERREAYDRFVYESGRAACEIGYWMFDPRNAARVDESKVTCPVLVITGAEDRITPVSVVRKVARKYRAQYKAFDRHAHWLLGEPGWEEVAQYADNWIAQLRA
jgi:pimeloyl-ACP methyl ester carboxylesterase